MCARPGEPDRRGGEDDSERRARLIQGLEVSKEHLDSLCVLAGQMKSHLSGIISKLSMGVAPDLAATTECMGAFTQLTLDSHPVAEHAVRVLYGTIRYIHDRESGIKNQE